MMKHPTPLSTSRDMPGGWGEGMWTFFKICTIWFHTDQFAKMTPETFNEGVQALGLTGDEVFNKELQDRIAIEYLAGSKRSKLQAWLRGEQNVTRAEAHEELAKEWASIPIGKSVTRKGQTMKRGESYYTPEGNVANAHTAEEVEALLDSLRPKNVGLDVPTTTDQGQEQ